MQPELLGQPETLAALRVLPFTIDKVQHAADLSEKDLRFIAKLDRIGYDRRPAVSLLEDVLAGRVSAWRLGSDGLVLLAETDDCLWIEGASGEQLLPWAEQYLMALKALAKGRPIRFSVSDPQLERFYVRLGFKPVAKIMEA